MCDGTIYVGQCGCPASNGGTCVHIACLLYMAEELSLVDENGVGRKARIDEACTSKLRAWGVASLKNVNPHAINEVVTLLE